MQFDRRRWKLTEIILPVIAFALIAIGLFALTIATSNPYTGEEATFSQIVSNLNFSSVGLQAAFVAAGTFIMIVLWLVDYHLYKKIWYIVLLVGVLLLAAVLVFGKVRGGTKGWIYLNAAGSITFQPTEVVKLAMILVCAKFLSDRPLETFVDLLPALGTFGIIMGVLIIQMDIGSTIVYIVAFMGMLFVSGAKLRHIGVLCLAAAVAAVIMWFLVLGDKQKSRITEFFNSGENQADSGFLQLQRSIQVIGSGGLTGKGLFSAGVLSQLDYIPVIETDFIFVAIAESFGFLGCFGLIAVFGALIFRMWQLMRNTEDKYGKLIICGIMFMFMFHIFENIGMVTGVMPITGIPLPFISKGGTNLVTNMAAIGLIMSVRFWQELPAYEGR